MVLARRVEAFLFDLDNTLYPPSSGLLEAGDALITAFIAERLGLPHAEADDLRVKLWQQYGATSYGLEVEHGVPEREFYEGSIERLNPADYLSPDPALGAMLAGLEGRKCVFTNSTARYARSVLEVLSIRDRIDSIFDIEFAGGIPKPQLQPYQRVLAALDCPARNVALLDDTEGNLEPGADLGMITIKLGEPPQANRHLHLRALHDLPDLLASP